MSVFVLVKRGVYRHEIPGAYTSLEHATAVAREALELEPDRYHYFEIVELQLDEPIRRSDANRALTVDDGGPVHTVTHETRHPCGCPTDKPMPERCPHVEEP